MSNDKEILDTAQKRLKLVAGTEAKQRAREVAALKFLVPEPQWDDAARQQRLGTSVGGPHGAVAIPPRPMLAIPKLLKPVALVNNQAKQAHLGINIHPLSEKADKDTAEVIQGLIRKIERDSHAHQGRLWAFDRASKAGRGCYRVNTCYEDDTEFPFDLSLKIERILYQENVYFDPSAQQMAEASSLAAE